MTVNIFTTGLMASGKDEFAHYLQTRHGFARTAFADGIRHTIKQFNPSYQFKSNRALEIDVGNTHRRWFGDSVWVRHALKYLDDHYPQSAPRVISDGRFPTEYDEMVVKRGWHHVHIQSQSSRRLGRLQQRDGHVNVAHFLDSADCEIPVTDSTIVLTNDGTLDEFHRQIDELITYLLEVSE